MQQVEVSIIQVEYVDDYRNRHICFVQTKREVDWLIDRFGRENVNLDNVKKFCYNNYIR